MSTPSHRRAIVTIGGGTGSYVLNGLKQFKNHIRLTAIVTMVDAGGSTGRLRDEFGYLPVGDVRMALVVWRAKIINTKLCCASYFYIGSIKVKGFQGTTLAIYFSCPDDLLGSEEADSSCRPGIASNRVGGACNDRVGTTSGHLR